MLELKQFIDSKNIELAESMTITLVPLVNQFRNRQNEKGRIETPTQDDVTLLEEIVMQSRVIAAQMNGDAFYNAFKEDVDDWISRSLSSPPLFDRTRDAFHKVENGGLVFFIGVTRAANGASGPGLRLETFIGQRHQPGLVTVAAKAFPHPHDVLMEIVLLGGSGGFVEGNCIVFFPENVAAITKVDKQQYAVFFFNKFKTIHEQIAYKNAQMLLDDKHALQHSVGLDQYRCYEIRSLWGYLHDRAHFTGTWPIGENTEVKMNWYVGVIEELKVDAKAILMAHYGDIPYLDELFSMVLLERLFRYPLEPNPRRNFDSGTGMFLFSYLLSKNAITQRGTQFDLNRDRITGAFKELVAEVEDLENASPEAEDYIANATKLVGRYLPPPEKKGEKFTFSEAHRMLTRNAAQFSEDKPLIFDLAGGLLI